MNTEYDSMEVPCGPEGTFAYNFIGCPTEEYQRTRFVQTQIAVDEAIIAVSYLSTHLYKIPL